MPAQWMGALSEVPLGCQVAFDECVLWHLWADGFTHVLLGVTVLFRSWLPALPVLAVLVVALCLLLPRGTAPSE